MTALLQSPFTSSLKNKIPSRVHNHNIHWIIKILTFEICLVVLIVDCLQPNSFITTVHARNNLLGFEIHDVRWSFSASLFLFCTFKISFYRFKHHFMMCHEMSNYCTENKSWNWTVPSSLVIIYVNLSNGFCHFLYAQYSHVEWPMICCEHKNSYIHQNNVRSKWVSELWLAIWCSVGS